MNESELLEQIWSLDNKTLLLQKSVLHPEVSLIKTSNIYELAKWQLNLGNVPIWWAYSNPYECINNRLPSSIYRVYGCFYAAQSIEAICFCLGDKFYLKEPDSIELASAMNESRILLSRIELSLIKTAPS